MHTMLPRNHIFLVSLVACMSQAAALNYQALAIRMRTMSTWLESQHPGAELLDRASSFGCFSSAFACSYANTVNDSRRDSICYTCMAFCGAGFLKKSHVPGTMYAAISYGYGLAVPACYFHATDSVKPPIATQMRLQAESVVCGDGTLSVPARLKRSKFSVLGTPDDVEELEHDSASSRELIGSDEKLQGSHSDLVSSTSERPSLFRLIVGDYKEKNASGAVVEE